MKVLRQEEAELEQPKDKSIMVRLGAVSKALVERAARHRGVTLNRYVRQATVKAALEDTAGLPDEVPSPSPVAADDAERVADHN